MNSAEAFSKKKSYPFLNILKCNFSSNLAFTNLRQATKDKCNIINTAPNWPFIIPTGNSGAFEKNSNHLLSQGEFSFPINIHKNQNNAVIPASARDSIKTEKQTTYQDSHIRSKRLLDEQGFLRLEYPTPRKSLSILVF